MVWQAKIRRIHGDMWASNYFKLRLKIRKSWDFLSIFISFLRSRFPERRPFRLLMISIPRSQATLPRPNNSASNAQSLATLRWDHRAGDPQELPCGLSCPIFIFGWFWNGFGMVLEWFLDGFGMFLDGFWMVLVDACGC
jgi:hypothetical protein